MYSGEGAAWGAGGWVEVGAVKYLVDMLVTVAVVVGFTGLKKKTRTGSA